MENKQYNKGTWKKKYDLWDPDFDIADVDAKEITRDEDYNKKAVLLALPSDDYKIPDSMKETVKEVFKLLNIAGYTARFTCQGNIGWASAIVNKMDKFEIYTGWKKICLPIGELGISIDKLKYYRDVHVEQAKNYFKLFSMDMKAAGARRAIMSGKIAAFSGITGDKPVDMIVVIDPHTPNYAKKIDFRASGEITDHYMVARKLGNVAVFNLANDEDVMSIKKLLKIKDALDDTDDVVEAPMEAPVEEAPEVETKPVETPATETPTTEAAKEAPVDNDDEW